VGLSLRAVAVALASEGRVSRRGRRFLPAGTALKPRAVIGGDLVAWRMLVRRQQVRQVLGVQGWGGAHGAFIKGAGEFLVAVRLAILHRNCGGLLDLAAAAIDLPRAGHVRILRRAIGWRPGDRIARELGGDHVAAGEFWLYLRGAERFIASPEIDPDDMPQGAKPDVEYFEPHRFEPTLAFASPRNFNHGPASSTIPGSRFLRFRLTRSSSA
jgi:hypothetical protein